MAKEAKTAAKQHRMNRPPPIPVAIPEADLVLDVNTARPSKEEIAKAIKKQRMEKLQARMSFQQKTLGKM